MILNTKISFITLFFLMNLAFLANHTNALDEKNNQLTDLSLNDQSSNLNLADNSEFIEWSTFLGGSEGEVSYSVATDSQKNVIVTGYTWSDDFPLFNAYDSIYRDTDAFLTKFSSTGELLWSTYLGGSADDNAFAVDIDSLDNIIVTGHTWSDDFDILDGNDTFSSGNGDSPNGNDVFITKFSSSGELLWSTYLGGSDNDYAKSVAIGDDDCIVVTGHTYSDDFPIINGYKTENGYQNAFVTKFSTSGELLWSTYLGGSYMEYGQFVALDSNDNIIVTGYTESNDFPTLNAYNETLGGYRDAFVTKFSSSGELLWSTYLGGSNSDVAKSLAIDSQDQIVITGYTSSDDFPILNSYDETYNDTDAFLTRFNSSGELQWSTFLGGSDDDSAYSVAIDANDNIIITGYTESDNFPILNSSDTTIGSVFVVMFNSSGNLVWSTILGGTSGEISNSVTIDTDDNIIITGFTQSSDFPVLNGYDETMNGDKDAFVTKLVYTLVDNEADNDSNTNAPVGSFLLAVCSFGLLITIYRRKKRSFQRGKDLR